MMNESRLQFRNAQKPLAVSQTLEQRKNHAYRSTDSDLEEQFYQRKSQ
jgi:hypothetical protein